MWEINNSATSVSGLDVSRVDQVWGGRKSRMQGEAGRVRGG